MSYDIGNGPSLYAISPAGLHQWNGHFWSSLTLTTGIKSITGADDGSGRAVYFSAEQVFRYRDGGVAQVGNIYPAAYPGNLIAVASHPSAAPSPLIALVTTGPLWAQVVSWTGQQWMLYRHFTAAKTIPTVQALTSIGQGYYILAAYADGGSFVPVVSNAPGFSSVTGCDPGDCGRIAWPRALIDADLGNGSNVYAAGCFGYYGSCSVVHPASNVVKLSQPPQPLGAGIPSSAQCLAAFDDGNGMALFAGGTDFLLRWNGTTWTSILPSPSGSISSMSVHDDGYGPGLYLSGTFTIPGFPEIRDVARWGPAQCYANCDNSRPPNGCAGLSAGDFQCFLNRFAAGDIRANCDASTAPPMLNINDFLCFVNLFAAGCS